MDKRYFTIGDVVRFVYHGEVRTGKVETVAEKFVRLVFEENRETCYKSFSYSKISRLETLEMA